MAGLALTIPVILVIAVYILIVKIAAIALKMTGMNEKMAYFQALSAFTSTGFTTRDSESILENDFRRRIVMALMILGNAGLVTVITTLVISITRSNFRLLLANIGIIVVLLAFLIKFSTHKGLTKFLNEKIESGLEKKPFFHRKPAEEILRIDKNYGIVEISIDKNCKNLGKTLSESNFRENDILVLAIKKNDYVVPAPKADDRMTLGDTLVCFGKFSSIERINRD